MRHTNIDPDRWRLLKAFVISCFLYALVAAVFFLTPFTLSRHGTGDAERSALSVSLSLLPAGSAPGVSGKTGRVFPVNAQKISGANAAYFSESENRALPDAVRSDISATENFDTGSDDASEIDTARGSEIGGGSGTVASGEGNGAGRGGADVFRVWLDSAIRQRLSYPERARRRNIAGDVVIRLKVNSGGSGCEAEILESSGASLLDNAALDLVNSLFPAPLSPGYGFTDTVRIRYELKDK